MANWKIGTPIDALDCICGKKPFLWNDTGTAVFWMECECGYATDLGTGEEIEDGIIGTAFGEVQFWNEFQASKRGEK